MIVSLIILAINLAIGAFVIYRCSRQRAYKDLEKEYKKVCEQNYELWKLVGDNSCDGKEENK